MTSKAEIDAKRSAKYTLHIIKEEIKNKSNKKLSKLFVLINFLKIIFIFLIYYIYLAI